MTDQLKQPSEAATWPREIWMAEREEHDQGVVTAVLSEFATVARWEGDKERDREFHHYIDADIHESSERYHKARYTALEAQLTEAREKELTWRKVAQSATPGGSEYMDPEYTRKRISQQRERLHNAMKAKVLAERELTEARAREAVAYEVAAKACWKQAAYRTEQLNLNVSDIQRARWIAGAKQAEMMAQAIEDMRPAHTTTALEQIKQQADKAGFERGMKRAAEIAETIAETCGLDQDGSPYVSDEVHLFGSGVAHDVHDAILATLSGTPKEITND